MSSSTDQKTTEPRRSFITQFLAGLAGVVALLGPVGAGIAVLLDPLGKKKSEGEWTRIATLDALPADGKPYRFAVVAEAPVDKWNLYEPQPIGSVYLTRTDDTSAPTAMSAVCPHLECTVDFRQKDHQFHCPCHGAVFDSDGTQTEKSTVSPRDLDTLDVEIRKGKEIWVDFRKFKAGVADQVVV